MGITTSHAVSYRDIESESLAKRWLDRTHRRYGAVRFIQFVHALGCPRGAQCDRGYVLSCQLVRPMQQAS